MLDACEAYKLGVVVSGPLHHVSATAMYVSNSVGDCLSAHVMNSRAYYYCEAVIAFDSLVLLLSFLVVA